MYLQSAEILNFRGIRHLKIDFEPETSALIGENAWGKSSLLSALWLLLGQGTEQLCAFSKQDLYIPIRLGEDEKFALPSSTVNQDALAALNTQANPKATDSTPALSDNLPSTRSAATATTAATSTTANSVASASPEAWANSGDSLFAANTPQMTTSSEKTAKNLLSSQLSYLTPEYLEQLKPYKVINTKEHQRYYFAIPNAEHTGNILRIIDLPLEPRQKTLSEHTYPKSKHQGKHRVYTGRVSKDKSHPKAKDSLPRAEQSYSFYNSALERFLANNGLSPHHLAYDLKESQKGQSKTPISKLVKATQDLTKTLNGQASSDNAATLVADAPTNPRASQDSSDVKNTAKTNGPSPLTKEDIFKALREAQKQEADFEQYQTTPINAQHLMLRARNLLERPEGLDDSERKFVQADYDFFANDIYQSSADKIVIDLVFCENNYGAINSIERFAKLRKACFYGDDGLYRVHYRITGEAASAYTQQLTPEAKVKAQQSGTVVYANSGTATSTQAYLQPDAPDDFNCRPEVGGNLNSARTTSYQTLQTAADKLTENPDDEEFVTIHELLDEKGRPLSNSLELIKDLITLNPLLRLRDRRMLKLSELEDAIEVTSDESSMTEDLCRLRSLFVSISQEDDLTCSQLNQGLAELNVIASKYLVNYRSNHYIQTHNPTKFRTARDIISHPVSIETLNSLKQSLEDKRPSRSKLLLSLLAGAMLMSNGSREIDTYSKPILVLEDIEGRFHPTLLLSFWSILDTIPIQKIVTTNSSALLSAMPMSNIRRLCRQYYDVRCYSVSNQAFDVDDARRIAFHIRISRPSAFFARCWILVEGETEVWMLNEIAGILGMNLACEGVKTIEFAQCGLAPLIKLAKQLGISYYVLTDGDEAGRKYAQTVQSFTGKQHISDHLSVIPHLDIEHYFYVSGYADVYQKAAGLNIQPKKNKPNRQEFSKLIDQAKLLQDISQTSNAQLAANTATTGTSDTNTTVIGLTSAAQGSQAASQIQGATGLIEIDPIPVTITLQQLLKYLQRWFGHKSATFKQNQKIKLTTAEQADLQQALELGVDFLSHPVSATTTTQASNEQTLSQQIQELTFDINRISIKDINEYYARSELNLRKSGGFNRKLTNKQRQAIQRLKQEKAEVLYGLKLTNQKPQSQLLFKNNGVSSKKKKNRQSKDSWRENFTLPSSLYNYLKHNFMQRQQAKIEQLKNHLSSTPTFKHSPELPNTMGSREWQYLKTLISQLQSLQHRQEQMQTSLTRNVSHALAQRLKFIKPDSSLGNSPSLQSTNTAATSHAVSATDTASTFSSNTNITSKYAQNKDKLQAELRTKTNLGEAGKLLSTRQWASKLAQEELEPRDMLKTDIELASAHLDPLDEAKVLRKARQQVGIKYGTYGAIEQSVLNKQGWSIDKIIDTAIHKKSKPGLAIMVVEAMQQRGTESVPQMFRTMFMKIRRIAKSEFGI